MIVKRNLSPWRVWQYIWREVGFCMAWSVIVYLAFRVGWVGALNFSVVGALGGALAIFVAFRNQSAYARWWEARTIWASIVGSSRIFGRLVSAFAVSHAHQPNYDVQRSTTFVREMIRRQVAWAHALRLHLRRQDTWNELAPWLSAEEVDMVRASSNKPDQLHRLMARQLYLAMGNGTLAGFDSFQIEGQLAALAGLQAACERIKETPLPRQYDHFTRLFVSLYVAVLPFGLLSVIGERAWLVVPLSVLVAGVFIIMEKTGAAVEEPFENRLTDVPMTDLCWVVERDLLATLGAPAPERPVYPIGYVM